MGRLKSILLSSKVNEPIHVVNVSLNVSLNDDHQILKYQSLDPYMLKYYPIMWFISELEG